MTPDYEATASEWRSECRLTLLLWLGRRHPPIEDPTPLDSGHGRLGLPRGILIVATGGVPLLLPPGGISRAPYGALLGRPIIPIEQASTLGTVGDIMLADMPHFVLADKGGMQTATSVHVRFVFEEAVLRFSYRVDGQPDLASAVTPYQGTATQSPFVVLATR